MMNRKNSVAAVVVFAFCLLGGAAYYVHTWPAVPQDARAPLAAVPTAMLEARTDATAASVASNASENDRQRAERERLLRERQKLRQANTTLQDTLWHTQDNKKRAEASAEMMADLNARLLDGSLKAPQTVQEAAALMGQNLSNTAKFTAKWGDRVPAAGTPEAAEYAREHDELVSESAALLKFMSDETNPSPFAQPGGLARFQAISLASALALRDDQAQAINATLDGYYQTFFSQGLNMAAREEMATGARPEIGMIPWNEQRLALSEQAYAAVTAILTPEQAAGFQALYPKPGIWMFHATFGGLPGVSTTF